MSRVIRVTRFHALNWYGYRDSIPVDGNLLLAGVTGSGKSILMDLIQLVLVGDLRLVKFNQSATGARSDRSLKGYCLGDTKQEEGGVTQYMRDSAVAYVALEFTWPNRRKIETWGFRIEFASAAESQGRVTPFFIPASLGRGDFLDEEKRLLDYTAFKALAESHTDRDGVRGRLYAELSEYLTHMAQPAHLNFDRSVLRSLLPTAMSFTFLPSFNDFCRKFILSADRLDVRDVTDSYRAFLRYEKDLTELNDQFRRLGEIGEFFKHHSELRRDATLARYLEAEFRHEHAATILREYEEELADLRVACAAEDARLRELETLIPKQRGDLEGVKNAIRDAGGTLYLELKRQNSELAARIEQKKEVGRTLQTALTARVKGARAWVRQVTELPLNLEAQSVSAIEKAIASMEAGGIAGFQVNFSALRDAAQKLASDVSRLAQPAVRQLSEVRTRLGELREQIAALSIGKLPFPTRLLDALNDAMLPRGAHLRARHLCELCEVNDERWRPAIEVAFTRKFAVVVDPDDYDEAERIYHSMREEARGESLINPMKASKLKRTIRSGSLAEKLTTSHPVAEAVVNQLFGELICVEHREELREHDAAITPDGFMARGAFVERTRHYDNLPFIGKRGLEQQRAYKERQRDELESEERRLRPLAEEVDIAQAKWRELFDAAPSLWQDVAAASELPELQQRLNENIKRLSEIDCAKFEDLAQRQGEMERVLGGLEREQRELDRSPKRQQFAQQETATQAQAEEAATLRGAFERAQQTDVSMWLSAACGTKGRDAREVSQTRCRRRQMLRPLPRARQGSG